MVEFKQNVLFSHGTAETKTTFLYVRVETKRYVSVFFVQLKRKFSYICENFGENENFGEMRLPEFHKFLLFREIEKNNFHFTYASAWKHEEHFALENEIKMVKSSESITPHGASKCVRDFCFWNQIWQTICARLPHSVIMAPVWEGGACIVFIAYVPLCWITPVVGTVTEKSNDYFATSYRALKKSNDYFATTTDPEKSNDYFATCYCLLEKVKIISLLVTGP
jgi:hypothetical protein